MSLFLFIFLKVSEVVFFLQKFKYDTPQMDVNIMLGNECAQWTIFVYSLVCVWDTCSCSDCVREEVDAILKESDKHIKFC